MVVTAACSTCRIAAAVVDTLVAPLGADEVRESLRVLRCVGRDSVAAHTRIRQGVGITAVGFRVGAVASSLEADEGAGGSLRGTPAVYGIH